jgi:hypothetical protein
MAIPAVRPLDSQQFNRFQGTVVLGASPTPPSGEVPSTAVIPGTALVKFGPLKIKPNSLNNEGGLPLPPALPATSDTTWAQNTQVLAKALDANITDIQLDAQAWEIDPFSDLPVLRLQITFAALPAEIDIHVEVKHTATR